MGYRGWQSHLIAFAVLFSAILALSIISYAPTASAALSEGDLAIVGVNFDTNEVAVVALADISAGETVFITDRGWDDATNSFTTSTSFDGVITWTTPTMSAGDIITFQITAASTVGASITGGGSTGSIGVSGWTFFTLADAHGFSDTGEAIIIYQGSTPNPSFIFAFNGIDGSGPCAGNTAVPANSWCGSVDVANLFGSTEPESGGTPIGSTAQVNLSGSSTAGEHQDNNVYNGPTTSADQSTWLTRISTEGNWNQDNTTSFDLDPDGTGDLPSGGFSVSTPVSDPTIDKAFSPNTILVGGTSTLTFTLTNTDASNALTNLAFTDSLPSGVEIAATPNIGGTCNSNNVLATHFTPNLAASGTAINLVSGSGYGLAASASCTITVDVTATTSGSKVNTTGALTSTETPSSTDTASDTLTVNTATPEINVERPALTTIADGNTDAQGSVAAGAGTTITYTVRNTGTATLNVTNITSASASNVTVNNITPTSFTVASGGGTTTFDVTYTVTGAGGFSFELDITNDDTDEGNYDIIVSGTGVTAPEIDVQRPASNSIADGNADVQGNQTAGSPVTITYTVENTGSDTLNVTNITSASPSNVTVNNITPTNFTVTSGGGTTTFDVTYTVTGAGAFSFELDITNDDADEGNYDITVSGTGTTGGGALALGDPDGDGDADILDARICLQIATGDITGTVDQQDACDVNGDNVVTADDAEQIAEFAIGLRGSVGALGLLVSIVLFLGLPLFAFFSRKRRSIITFGLFLFGLVIVMTGCTLFPQGTTALIAATTDQFITVSVTNMPDGGLASFSADAGGFTFDPNIISVDSIQAIGGFQLLSSQIDNVNGEVRWGTANPTGGVVNGTILLMNITVKVSFFSPDLAGVSWARGKLTLGSDNNNEISPSDYRIFPR